MTFQKGNCLCGKVEIQIAADINQIGACHCTMCRKWSGGPFFAIECGSEIKVEGQEYVSLFESSDWAKRAFCKECGSCLYYQLKDNSFYAVSAELFNNPNFKFASQVFIDEKPKYYEFSNQTHTMTGAELFAAHVPKE